MRSFFEEQKKLEPSVDIFFSISMTVCLVLMTVLFWRMEQQFEKLEKIIVEVKWDKQPIAF